MSKTYTKPQIRCPDVATTVDGQYSASTVSTIETARGPNAARAPKSGQIDPCHGPPIMRSRVEQLEYAKARGWLNVHEAADYLDLSPKTLYNLKSKGRIKSIGQRRKLIFELSELILQSVREKFGVNLEREVNIV